MSVPGWPSLEPAEHENEPVPYPGCVSGFEEKIFHFKESVGYAARSVVAIKDCIKMETRTLKDRNSSAEEKAEAREAIAQAKALLPGWQAELVSRSKIHTRLRQEWRRGIDPRTKKPRLCGAKNKSNGQPCGNEMHFTKGKGWGPCYQHPTR
jgi:hypothetical protein